MKSRLWVIFLFSSVFAISATDCAMSASADASLRGRLISPDGETIIKQFPVLVQGSEESFVATTDDNGVFEVTLTSPGHYQIVPANEPHLVKEVSVAPKSFWESLIRGTDSEAIDVGDFYIEADKSYREEFGGSNWVESLSAQEASAILAERTDLLTAAIAALGKREEELAADRAADIADFQVAYMASSNTSPHYKRLIALLPEKSLRAQLMLVIRIGLTILTR